MKKNILVLLTASSGAGAERLVLYQMKNYDRKRFNLHVITLRKGNLEGEFGNVDKINYSCVNSKRKLSLKPIKKLLGYVNKNKIELIHTHLIEADMYGFITKLMNPKIKLICTKHDTNEFRRKIFWRLINKLFSLNVNQVLAVSKSVKEFITKYEFIPPQKIKVLYNGINTNKFKISEDTKKLKQEFKLKDKDFIIGIAGRLIKQKGHRYLFKAIATLKDKIPGIKLLIVGDGEIRKELEEYVHKLNIEREVIFLGFRKDMPALYSLMDVFCLPSEFEGFGVVLIEAMACEKPVVATKVGGVPEVVLDGETGILVPPKNPDALAQAILKLLTNPVLSKGMGQAGRIRVEKYFAIGRMVKETEKVYNNFINEKIGD